VASPDDPPEDLDPASPLPPASVLGPELGTLDNLPELLESGHADDLILAGNSYHWQTQLIDRLALVGGGGGVLLLPSPFESLIGRMRYRWVDDVPLIEVVRQSEWQARRPVKRLVDLVAGTLLLVLSLPVMLLCALAIRLSGRGPVFYRQRRVGRGGGTFTLWKFRTMRPDAERGTGEVLAEQDDPRLTPVGAWLRRYRLDELPQLIHVLSGSMSLVGPRPERPGFVERYRREVPGYAERFSVRPGLTGLAQTHGDYHSTPGNKLRYDLAYIANWSPWLDLAILLRTVKIVLTSRGV
jgi:exopolysaccharide biosynthesis polyprenyl glycosylphosphotransferase